MNITDAMLVEKYLETKAELTALKERHAAETKPLEDAMTLIENAFLERLNERGADNSKTEHGTAYKSTLLNVKVIDRDAFLKFCTTYWDTVGGDMLNVSAIKDPVKTYIEAHNMPPPGLETSQFVRVNIRRT